MVDSMEDLVGRQAVSAALKVAEAPLAAEEQAEDFKFLIIGRVSPPNSL